MAVGFLTPASPASALEKICDVANENCRTPLLNLINNETQGIDVAFWFMEDTRYATALINRWKAGVPVRVLMDTRANAQYPGNITSLQMLRDAGIPMREKFSSEGILHWKLMLFVGQNTVQFSGANYSDEAFVPATPYADYVDEVIYFTQKDSLVDSFRSRYDDAWTDTVKFRNYANVTATPTRAYGPAITQDPALVWVPWQNFASKSVAKYNLETLSSYPPDAATGTRGAAIDAIMYRVTDRLHTDAMIAAKQRGVAVRLIHEPLQYRDVTRVYDAWNIDRMYMAGIEIRQRKHAGLSHEKLTVLHGQKLTIFGSSNWSPASADGQHEHNLFTVDPDWYAWAVAHFERKWNNTAPGGIVETEPFVPLPPDTPVLKGPVNGATGQSTTSVTLRWYGGPWAHRYDVYIGTSSNSASMTKLMNDQELGPSESTSQYQAVAAKNLLPGTTYYWKVVGRTMAGLERTSNTFSFTTIGGTAQPLPTGWTTVDIGSVGVVGSTGYNNGTFNVAGSGTDVWGAADEFHFAYQTFTGDTSIVARVTAVEPVDIWTKAGVMIRGGVTSDAPHATMLVSAGRGLAFQRRRAAGGDSFSTAGAAGGAPYWVKLVRTGNTIQAYQSTDGATWALVGSDTVALPSTIYVGLAVTSHNNTALASGSFTNVVIGGTAAPPPPPPPDVLPADWTGRDVGSVGVNGTSAQSNGTFTIKGSGSDIWGTADAFQFAYRTMSGNASVVARVTSITQADAWSKAGVMIRSSLGAGASHATMLVSAAKGLAFQRRVADGGVTTNTSGPLLGAPYWVRITRVGNTFTASRSTDGVTWVDVATDTITMPTNIYVGLAVTSHNNTALATGTFDNLTISVPDAGAPPPPPPPPPPLPTGWTFDDIGTVGAAGGGSESNGIYTVRGAGADIWGTADALSFAHTTLVGNGEIVARVASVQNINAWTKAGVMIRDGVTAGAAHALMLATPTTTKGTAFQRRVTAGGQSTHTAGPTVAPPYWVRLTRSGNTLTASTSANGTTWTTVATEPIVMGSSVEVGLAVSSHVTGTTATATFDNVSITAAP